MDNKQSEAERQLIDKVKELADSGFYDDHDGWVFNDYRLPEFQKTAEEAAVLIITQGVQNTSEEIRLLAREIQAIGDAGFNNVHTIGNAFLSAAQEFPEEPAVIQNPEPPEEHISQTPAPKQNPFKFAL